MNFEADNGVVVSARRLFLFLLGLLGLTLLVGCSAAGGGVVISNVSQSTDTIVPGSTGVGKPPGAIEVRYTLNSWQLVAATIKGETVDATLLQGPQDAGER